MDFSWNVLGHQNQLLSLEQDFRSNKLAHAYLFHGPPAIGKFLVALKFAVLIQGGDSILDKIVYEDDNESIKISEVRALIEKVNLTKQSTNKIVVIQNIERMTTESANALLKTLEEPPEGTIFLLTSSNISKVLKTIISRCRPMAFYPISRDDMVRAFKDEVLVEFCNGHPGKAFCLINEEGENSFLKKLQLVEGLLLESSVSERFNYIESIVEEKTKIIEFFDLCEYVLRRMLIGGDHDSVILRKITNIDKSRVLLQNNVNSRLLVESFMLNI